MSCQNRDFQSEIDALGNTGEAFMSAIELLTRASSINRALDQVGDKWSMLIIQEVFWGIHSFTGLLKATGASRGVLTDRLTWLIGIDCLKRQSPETGGKRAEYHLTKKSVDLYATALMALEWEREFCPSADLEQLKLRHLDCGLDCNAHFEPQMCCSHCNEIVRLEDVYYKSCPDTAHDVRPKKIRRRSSVTIDRVPTSRTAYKNLINIVGDRWTANVIALAFQNIKRFDEFHRELPIATNILSDRLRFLTKEKVFEQVPYQTQPVRYEYQLTTKGKAFFPYFLALSEWGDKWCSQSNGGESIQLYHKTCGNKLKAIVVCNQCGKPVKGHDVVYQFGEED